MAMFVSFVAATVKALQTNYVIRFTEKMSTLSFYSVQDIRLQYDKIQPTDNIPDDCCSVGWMDGDWPHLKAVTSEEVLELSKHYKHTDCKHAAGASTVQQPCDTGVIFKMQHGLQSITTEKDECSSLANSIYKLLGEYPGLKLADHKRRALADGISCQPKNHQRVCTVDNTRNSFIEPGLLDEGSKHSPDMLRILKTRRKTLLKEELELVVENFERLYQMITQNGHITDEELTGMGFPSDKDMDEKEVHREADISQEPYQRAKILSHDEQRQRRRR